MSASQNDIIGTIDRVLREFRSNYESKPEAQDKAWDEYFSENKALVQIQCKAKVNFELNELERKS